ncbi:MAG: FeoC-like transcriptional regulator [Betaproteobacteria bacterium]|nr:FeoC-like transcriptional regulator [Betaproteobacteria bacterium]
MNAAILTPGALRAYLRQQGEASVSELSAHFSAPVKMVEGVLAYWQHRGNIEARNSGADDHHVSEKSALPCGGGCSACLTACADFNAISSSPVLRWKE